ncbi:hypothetical protein FO519_010641, partial [Halicephalobus sp. NKZ332]
HLAYCPQPTDPDSYTYCCKSYYFGHTEKPSCCMFAVSVGVVIALIISAVILFAVLMFLTCWCLPCCPLNKRIAEVRHEREMDEYESEQIEQRKYY